MMTKILRSSTESSNPRAMFLLYLTNAKILDYNIVTSINLVFSLFKMTNLGHTAIAFLQKSLQLKPFQKVKIEISCLRSTERENLPCLLFLFKIPPLHKKMPIAP